MAEATDWTTRMDTLGGLWPVIALFSLVMGGIYGGWFTATEAAGIGATGAFAFALTHRSLTLNDIGVILIDTALVSASMFAIVFGAATFVEFINITGVHKGLETLVKTSGAHPFGVILITVPIFFPVVVALGYDPVWFGIVVVATEIGLITPPIGVNLFVIRSIAPDIAMRTILSGMLPFITVDMLRIVLLAAVPALSLWLPGLLFK